MRFLTPTLHRRPGLVVRRLGDPFDLFQNMTGASHGGTALLPRLDVRETDEAILVEADLPGVAPEALELRLEEGALVLKGEKADPWAVPAEDSGEAAAAPPAARTHRAERAFGSFQRHLPLPADVDEERIEATFRHGVLRVSLPKAASVETSRKIEVRVDD